MDTPAICARLRWRGTHILKTQKHYALNLHTSSSSDMMIVTMPVRTVVLLCVFMLIHVMIQPIVGWVMMSSHAGGDGTVSRSKFLDLTSAAAVGWISLGYSTLTLQDAHADDLEGFVSAGFVRSEYTNSITASRDTNISPKEVYDSILGLNIRAKDGAAALDVGAGAGVSTQTLYQMGFTNIDALDWSSDAWNINVVENGHCPDSVHFYNLDDERFLNLWRQSIARKYDVIVFNFAVNSDKATQFATELLKSDGVLLAPVNNQRDYWLKQSFHVLNSQGKLLSSVSDVGAWSVQFQPDVTQDTCQGIWCAPFNGFQKQ